MNGPVLIPICSWFLTALSDFFNSLLDWHPQQLRQPLDVQIARIIGQHRSSKKHRRYQRGPDQLATHLWCDRRTGIGARNDLTRPLAVFMLAADAEWQRQEQHDPPEHEVDREGG